MKLIIVLLMLLPSVAFAQSETVTTSITTVSAVVVDSAGNCVVLQEHVSIPCTEGLVVIVNGEEIPYEEYLEILEQ